MAISGLGVIVLLFAAMLYFYYVYPGRDRPAAADLFQPPGPCRGEGDQLPVLPSLRGTVPECRPSVRWKNVFSAMNTSFRTIPRFSRKRNITDRKKPVPWVRIFWVPDFVYFNHLPHIKWAGLDCSQCHGDVKTMDRLHPVNFKMGFCIGCHRQMKAQMDCWLACHR